MVISKFDHAMQRSFNECRRARVMTKKVTSTLGVKMAILVVINNYAYATDVIIPPWLVRFG